MSAYYICLITVEFISFPNSLAKYITTKNVNYKHEKPKCLNKTKSNHNDYLELLKRKPASDLNALVF